MSKQYDIDTITTKMENNLTKSKGLLAAWQAVTYPTKKDGTPFKILSKNIEGASLGQSRYLPRYGENELTVYTDHLKGCGYCSDTIWCYETLSPYSESESAKAKPENVVKGDFGNEVYTFDLDDIKQAVNARINDLEKKIASLEKQLTVIEEVYNNFYNAYETALNALYECTKDEEGYKGDLYYLVRDIVKNNVLIG